MRIRGPAGRTAAIALAMTACALAGAPVAGAAVDPALTRYPYLTDSIQDSITVNWATTQAGTAGSVQYGPAGSCTQTTKGASRTGIKVNGVPEYQWKVTIPVTPDTSYCYRVRLGTTDLLGGDPSPTFTSQVAKGSSTPFSFAVLGDWGQAHAMAPGDPNANPDMANVLREIASSGVRFVVMTGDVTHPDSSQTAYGDLWQAGENMSGVFGPDFWTVPGRSIPAFNVTGNHGYSEGNTQKVIWPEDHVADSSGGSYEVVTDPAMPELGTAEKSGPAFWYAFDAGPARFYALTAAWADGNPSRDVAYAADRAAHWEPGKAEYEWLKADLAAHPGGLKFAFWHYPLEADTGGSRSDTELQGGPGTLQGLLDANHVNIVFNGHAHDYERNKPDPAGMVPYVFGNGGADLEPVGPCSDFNAYAIGFSSHGGSSCGSAPVPTGRAQVYGFAKVTVNGQHVTVTPTDSTGRSFDVQTYSFGPESDSRAPSTPDGLRTSAVAQSRVDLAWDASTDNVGVTGYRIYRDGELLHTLRGTGTTYSDATVTPGQTYSYQVAALDAGGNQSANSASLRVTTPGPQDTEAPTVPGNLRAEAASSSHVVLSWRPSTDNVGVVGYVTTRDGMPLALADPATTYDDGDVAPATTYTYGVYAVDEAGNRSPVSTIAVTTPLTGGAGTTTLPVTSPAPLSPGGTPSHASSLSPAPLVSSPSVPRGACAVRTRGHGSRDLLAGTPRGDRLSGRGGNDLLQGSGGRDCLFGGAGRDVLRGGSGNDRLSGGTGSDHLHGGTGSDRLRGGTGSDRLLGGRGRDRLSGGSGNDRLDGDRGADRIGGGRGRDTIDARDGLRDIVDCGPGHDTAHVDRHDRVRRCEKVTRTTHAAHPAEGHRRSRSASTTHVVRRGAAAYARFIAR